LEEAQVFVCLLLARLEAVLCCDIQESLELLLAVDQMTLDIILLEISWAQIVVADALCL